ncbi:MAG: hypothetical protein J7K46_06485, partial [Bacteroidales bacterium]|nr:hypothetical protein [Bacteroidales bacterium]
MRPENYTAQIREILASYSTGKIYRISRVSRGFANINFIAETDTGRYLVRFCRKQSLENIEKEVLLMQV